MTKLMREEQSRKILRYYSYFAIALKRKLTFRMPYFEKLCFCVIFFPMVSFFSNNKRKKLMSAFMAFWLTGLVFVFCCGMMETPASIEFCPLAKAGSHCDKSKNETNIPNFSDKSDSVIFDCCAFLPQLFEKTRKLEKIQQLEQVSDKIKIDFPRFVIFENNFQSSEFYQPPLFHSNQIFIKHCVFRI